MKLLKKICLLVFLGAKKIYFLPATIRYRLTKITNKLKPLSPVNLPRLNFNYFYSFLSSHIIYYPAPITLTFAWSFGALAGICLVVQMISGILLSTYYVPRMDLAFRSIEYVMRRVNNGWLLRYMHSNGSSMFFITVYLHILRGLYYGSYMKPREFLWCSGVILYLLMMVTAFTGYVLPWGQLSFWGGTVGTNMITVFPYIGKPIARWFWGAWIFGGTALKRIYSIHFAFPFLVAAMTFIHLILLHRHGSNSLVGSGKLRDDVSFYPYFFSKDVVALSCFSSVFVFLVFFDPNLLNNPDNYDKADPIEVPFHVKPEWYFYPFFAILRAIPHKAGGLALMAGTVLILFFLPFMVNPHVRNSSYRPLYRFWFWFHVHTLMCLFFLGHVTPSPFLSKNMVYPYFGRLFTAAYYLFFIMIPVVGYLETKIYYYRANNDYDNKVDAWNRMHYRKLRRFLRFLKKWLYRLFFLVEWSVYAILFIYCIFLFFFENVLVAIVELWRRYTRRTKKDKNLWEEYRDWKRKKIKDTKNFFFVKYPPYWMREGLKKDWNRFNKNQQRCDENWQRLYRCWEKTYWSFYRWFKKRW